jgi:DNA-binding transcriptional regulator LsrR (DeoR family)
MGRSGPLADREIMRLVAELYYERDLRQPEVAAVTGFSVSKVSRLLSAAREQGIVNISVEPAGEERPAIATELADRFGVEIEITPGREHDDAAAARLSGLAAADRLVPRLPEVGAVGIAAGYTVSALAAALPRLERPGLTIVPLVGGWDTQHAFLDGNQVARRIADRLGAEARTLHAPAVVDTPAVRATLLRDATISATTSQWTKLALAVVGIGGTPEGHPGYRTVVDRLGEDSREDLRRLGAVGDLSGHFFRADGTFIEEWSERMLAVPVDALRRLEGVFAIAAGSGKARPILGALRSGVLNVLVTDRHTAEAVMSLDRQPA